MYLYWKIHKLFFISLININYIFVFMPDVMFIQEYLLFLQFTIGLIKSYYTRKQSFFVVFP